MEDYASMHNMSVSWFIRNFRQRIGTTPTQYIMSKRIANAQMLLESSDYNMTEIAKIVGYDNPLYFSRVFKKKRNVSYGVQEVDQTLTNNWKNLSISVYII